VIEELLGALIGIEPDGTILSWNKGAETLFGFTSADPARPEFASQGWPRGPGRSEGGPRARRIPIVVLTSSKADEDVLRSYNLHVNCYVPKPVGSSSSRWSCAVSRTSGWRS
jgi:hypothetical protein